MIGFLATRGLFRHTARTFLGVLGVGVAGALLFDMQMLSRGLQASLHRILRQIGYEVRVTPRGTLPFETDATFPEGHRIVIRRNMDCIQSFCVLQKNHGDNLRRVSLKPES